VINIKLKFPFLT